MINKDDWSYVIVGLFCDRYKPTTKSLPEGFTPPEDWGFVEA